MIKVGLILEIAGACRTDELVNLTVDDIEDIPRIFVVTDVRNMLELFRKYLSLRPPHVKHKRLFLYYKAGKCSSQPVDKNTMGKIPSVVASYLKLPDVACYKYWSLLTKIFSDITGRCWCGYHDNKASCWLEINDSR
ncbi:hypothetical protein NQ317_011474 [Molorchus minor]|uniref:Uncharacterized protein n=1 Tax=Molorchus minor TaxID=1323400 RepID=A0ABQ9JN83_9CUCU|nr:hypothetical protein NQ317_011474 [Molorchus minor]